MRFNGTVVIHAPRERVWRFLTDPHELMQCAPGLESLDIIAPNERFRAVASAGFGAVKATFITDVTWTSLDAPNHASMKMHGKAPGSVFDATSEMQLTDAGDGATNLAWSSDVTVVGTIASLAARLMGPVTKSLTDSFFRCVSKRIEGSPT